MKKSACCSVTFVLLFLAMVVSSSFAWEQEGGYWDHRACKNNVVPNPTVIGPIPANVPPGDPSHDYTFLTPIIHLAAYGYVQEEFFVEGMANRYNTPTGQTGSIIPGGPYPYKTRIVVRRPVSPHRFNGVVLLEWQNVGQGFDLEAIWGDAWKGMVDSGYAWVGVSCQAAGIHNASTGLKVWSPIRYGTLDVTVGGTITDDSLMHDIYSQAAQAIQCPKGVDPMGGLPVKLVLCIVATPGQTILYYNSIQPLHHVIDGFWFTRGGYGLRTDDLGVKVFHTVSEREVVASAYERPVDSDHFRYYETAGASHWSFNNQMYHVPVENRDGIPVVTATCNLPPFSEIPDHYLGDAVLAHLVRWIMDGTPPPSAPYIELVSVGPPAVIARDSYGNSISGGVRLPQLAVPTATNTGVNSGTGALAAAYCSLWGSSQPFGDATLDALYPNHRAYVHAFEQSVWENLKAGFILAQDAEEMTVEAAQSDIPPK